MSGTYQEKWRPNQRNRSSDADLTGVIQQLAVVVSVPAFIPIAPLAKRDTPYTAKVSALTLWRGAGYALRRAHRSTRNMRI
jgi:hypothetical protein